MATVCKHKLSPYWTAIYRDDRKVWRRKTTKQRNRSKALFIALEWERAADLARDGKLTEPTARMILAGIVARITHRKG